MDSIWLLFVFCFVANLDFDNYLGNKNKYNSDFFIITRKKRFFHISIFVKFICKTFITISKNPHINKLCKGRNRPSLSLDYEIKQFHEICYLKISNYRKTSYQIRKPVIMMLPHVCWRLLSSIHVQTVKWFARSFKIRVQPAHSFWYYLFCFEMKQ